MTSASLCANPAAVSVVRVAHVPAIAQLEPSKPGQSRVFTITVTDRAKARALARAVCSLPPLRHMSMRCHVSFGGGYQLRFSDMSRRLPAVAVEAAGCQAVTGTDRTLAANSRFWAVFEQATGIHAVNHAGVPGHLCAPVPCG